MTARCYPAGDGCGNPECPCVQDYDPRPLLTSVDDEELDLPPELPSDMLDTESSDEEGPLSLHKALSVFEGAFRRQWLGDSPAVHEMRELVQALIVSTHFGMRVDIEQDARALADAISTLVEERECALIRVKQVQSRLADNGLEVLERVGEMADAAIRKSLGRSEDALRLVDRVHVDRRSA